MSVLKATHAAQKPMVAEFVFNVDDTMIDVNGVSKTFGSAAAATTTFDVIKLPVNSVILSGEVVTETAVTGSTAYNVIVGDSATSNRYLGTTDKTTAARTALVPTGYVNTGGLSLRVAVAPTVAASTAGKLSVKIEYMIRDRADEVTAHP